MGLPAFTKAYYENFFHPAAVRSIVYPATGLGAGAGLGVVATSGAALTWGVWVDVVISATIARDSLATHIFINSPSGVEVFAIQIGSAVGYANAAAVIAAGAAVILAAARAEVRVEVATDAGLMPPVVLPMPVWYGTGEGIIARISTVSGADTLGVAVAVNQAFS